MAGDSTSVSKSTVRVGDRVARQARCQRGRRLPAFRILHARREGDLADEIARRIERDRIPLQAQHVGRGDDAALVAGGRREILEGGGHRLRTVWQIEVESVDVHRVTHPGDRLAVDAERDASDLADLARRAVVAGQPLGQQQGELPTLRDRNHFLHREDSARHIGGVDRELDRAARIGPVLRRWDRIGDGEGLRQAVAGGLRGGVRGTGDQRQRRDAQREAGQIEHENDISATGTRRFHCALRYDRPERATLFQIFQSVFAPASVPVSAFFFLASSIASTIT